MSDIYSATKDLYMCFSVWKFLPMPQYTTPKIHPLCYVCAQGVPANPKKASQSPHPLSSSYTLALLGAIVRLRFLFSSVSSMTGSNPFSLNSPKYSFPNL
jgi:hypothetical protein